MPRIVFINETASAPDFTAAFAISVMSVTFGVNLTIRGRSVAPLTAFTISSVPTGEHPNCIPPDFTFGHEIFNSRAFTAFSFDRVLANSTNSFSDSPAMFTMTVVSNLERKGNCSSMNILMPSFCSPMEFNIPEGVSHILGGALPSLAFKLTLFVIIAPSLFKSINSEYSLP